MTNRKFLSFLLAIFMFFSTITPLFAENDSVTVLPPRMAEKEEPQNIVIMENDKDTIPIIDKSEEGGKKIEETPEEPEIKEDNSPVILENREENNNIVILPPIKNEENEEGITEPSKETVEPEEPKKEKENKREVKVQILSKRDAKKPASEGEVNLVLLNDNPADINEEVYDEKIRWKESDFKVEDDKIISLSDEGLLKVARNKKLIIPEMENITIIEKEAFKGLSLRSVEIPKNIKEIKDEAFKDNPLSFVKILGKGKEISKNAFNEELLEMYKKSEEEEFLYECEDELEIGKEIVGDAVGALAPDDVSLYTFKGTTITGLSEKGKVYYETNHDMVLPGKNPEGQEITKVSSSAFNNNDKGYGLTSVDFSNCTSLESIGDSAFKNNQLTEVNFSGCTNLESIGDSAFYGSQLKSLDLSSCRNLVSIDSNAFRKNQLTSLNLSGCIRLKYIGMATFNMNKLTALDLSRCANLISIGSGAFESNKLTSLDLSGCKNLKSIGNYAFEKNQLTNLDLSECKNLTDIGFYAFRENQLINLDLSGCTNLKAIGNDAFRGNQLMNLDLSKCTSLTSISYDTFTDNQLKTAKIPLSLTILSDDAFEGNPGNNDKKQVYLFTPDYTNPNNLKDGTYHLINPVESSDDVTLYTFNGTTITGLSERGKEYFIEHHDMILPGKNPQGQAITEIGREAFYNNAKGYGLTSVDFSNCTSLISMSSYAFGFNQIKSLDLSGCKSLASIDNNVFQNNQLKTAKIPLSLKTLADTAFESNPGNNDKKQVYLFTPDYTNPNNLKDSIYHLINPITGSDDVSLYTFDGTTITGLSERGKDYFIEHHDMILPGKNPQGQSITAIGKGAFNNKDSGYGLTSVDFSNCTNLTSIGDIAFQRNQITSLDLSRCVNLTSIGQSAFMNNRITNLDLSGCVNLKSIDDWAFDMNQIASLDLSGCTNLTSIGQSAFANNQLTSLDLSGCTNLTRIGFYSFMRNQLISLNLSGCTSLTTIGFYAFYDNRLATLDLSMLSNLINIYNVAFGNNHLKTAKISLSLTSLADDAFQGNPGSNDKKQVYLYTPDYTNPNNLKDSDYHLINPITGPDDLSLFTFEGTTLTGLTRRGENYYAAFDAPPLTLPGKNPQGELITKVADKAFSSEDRPYLRFKGINFSNCTGLKIIGKESFARGEYGTVDLSPCTNLEVIGESAFYFSSTNTVNLSGLKNLKRIEMGAFSTFNGQNPVNNLNISGCTALEYIGVEAFAYTKIKSLDLSDSVNLKEVGEDAFANHNIVSLNLSGLKNLTKIGMGAFRSEDGNLKNVNLSGCTGLEIIEKQAFGWAGLETIDLTPCTNLKTIESQAFVYGKLKTAKIPLSLVNLANDAFMENSGNNYNRQVFLYTPDYTNPNNLRDSRYHLINPITGSDDMSLYTFNGTIITGLSGRGKKYFETHHDMKLPGKNPQGQAITAIGKKAFYNNGNGYGLTSVDFSNCTNLTSIGDSAFYRNQLTSLDLSKCTNLEIINSWAFTDNQIANLNLSGCTNLTSIGGAAFSSNQLTSLNLSSCTNLVSISNAAFSSNQLTSLNLSGCTSLTSIGQSAFRRNQLTSLDLSGCINLASIANGAFYNNQIANLNLFGCTSLKTIDDYAFHSNLLKTAKIPLSLTTLADSAFANNIGSNDRKQVYLYTPDYTNPNNLPDTDYHLINPITGSDDVTLYTFDGTTITGLSDRGKKYFAENHEMVLPGKNPQGQAITVIGDDAFCNNGNGYGITNADLSSCTSLASIGDSAFRSNQLTNLNLSKCANLKNIGDRAFQAGKLTNLDLSECVNLKSIGNTAFQGNKLKALDLSKCMSLTSVGKYAFVMNSLKIVNIPLSLTTLADTAFMWNPGNNAKGEVYLYTPRRNNPMNLKDSSHHLVDPITFTIKKVDAKGNPMEGVEFAFYKVDRPAPPVPPQNGANKTDDTELEISSENVSSAVGGITMPDIDLTLLPDGPRPEFFPNPSTVVGVKPIFMTAITDENGTAEVTLPYSPYFLVENKTIPGYSINNTITQIDATTEGKIITYTDYEVSIEIPETGTLGIIPYILLALILVGGAYVVLRKKKEEEK